jgi:hypothetical protein
LSTGECVEKCTKPIDTDRHPHSTKLLPPSAIFSCCGEGKKGKGGRKRGKEEREKGKREEEEERENRRLDITPSSRPDGSLNEL